MIKHQCWRHCQFFYSLFSGTNRKSCDAGFVDLNKNTVPRGCMATSISVFLGLAQHGPHGDKGKAVGVGESLMNCKVKGLP